MSAFRNRLQKNFRHFSKWARRQGLTAYRIYDRDIPEFPFAIDWYEGRAHLIHFPRSLALREGTAATERDDAALAVAEVLGIPPPRIFCKTHTPKVWGRDQYQRVGRVTESFTVEEQGLRFWVNLGDYLDTGLFLDHRLTRARIREEARGARFLNLFAYTGSFTVYAAAGGAASTVSVDLSEKYLDWMGRNLALNRLSASRHQSARGDALRWIEQAQMKRQVYDLVVVDPPPFSASKRMKRRFDVQRDHPRLLADVAQLLAPKGALYFSTSFQGFQPSFDHVSGLSLVEITPRSLPPDFRGDIHRCWRGIRDR